MESSEHSAMLNIASLQWLGKALGIRRILFVPSHGWRSFSIPGNRFFASGDIVVFAMNAIFFLGPEMTN